MQLLFHPRGSGVEWSGEKVARIWNIVIWNWKASWKNSLFTCSRTYPLFTQESTTFVTTRSARRLVNWSSLRPLHLARSLNAAAAANSLRARQISRDKYQWWFEIVESTRREYFFDSKSWITAHDSWTVFEVGFLIEGFLFLFFEKVWIARFDIWFERVYELYIILIT